ncbi:DUF6009 family protein [Streptomyces europaeiscabiei]|uniref:DUF6009 family protein n=1 Tax=Streptomyces europaeiscabiei TaxID=146819 RepID=A0ABU4NHE4_9ACTN|nr:DUF6009 family protein [Streptomyces europaeiscabiei]MDX3542875.1 DUF6009 family protein [Streptomyces europaeiscabiei]MDX3552691.1 DUF6009 family protein [Streptomyces europaeiscabiei]MDX3700865.1 DUF6009 family protein [Streptomyces europaeiscabiei]
MGEDPRALEHEDGIVWTEDIERFDYVRQSVQLSVATRRGPVAWKGNGHRVGYGVLQADAPSGDVPGKFIRRVFWVKDHDRSEQPSGLYKSTAPSEAVDPRTVTPGVWGELTERAWGGPFPTA